MPSPDLVAGQSKWNDEEPFSVPVPNHPMERIWYARAWPWVGHRPVVGYGNTRESALSSLRDIISQELGIA